MKLDENILIDTSEDTEVFLEPSGLNYATPASKGILTVAEYLECAQELLKPLKVSVQGEISELNPWNGGAFITLSDKNSNAIMKCFIYGYTLQKIDVSLSVGLEVQIYGIPYIHKPRGELSFTINQITPVGEGALRQAYLARKKRLELRGYFDPRNKKELPAFVTRIGLLTSPRADGNIDFVEQLGDYGFKLFFKPVRVEGIQATESIVNGIEWFNKSNLNLDLLVITRGGGGYESLAAFDTEEIALAIHASRIPVMTAIGHRADVTIAQLTADIAANTPTDAAKIIRLPWDDARKLLNEMEKNMYGYFKQQINYYEDKLSIYSQGYIKAFSKQINQQKRELFYLQESLIERFEDILEDLRTVQRNFQNNYNKFESQVISLHENISNYTDNHVQNYRVFKYWISSQNKDVADINKIIYRDSIRWIKQLMDKLSEEERRMDSSNPLKRLEQGYSIIYNSSGKVIKSTQDLAIEESVKVKLNKGSFESVVKKVTE